MSTIAELEEKLAEQERAFQAARETAAALIPSTLALIVDYVRRKNVLLVAEVLKSRAGQITRAPAESVKQAKQELAALDETLPGDVRKHLIEKCWWPHSDSRWAENTTSGTFDDLGYTVQDKSGVIGGVYRILGHAPQIMHKHGLISHESFEVGGSRYAAVGSGVHATFTYERTHGGYPHMGDDLTHGPLSEYITACAALRRLAAERTRTQDELTRAQAQEKWRQA